MTIRYRYEKALEVLDRLDLNVQHSKKGSLFITDLHGIRALALLVQDNIKECEKVTMEILVKRNAKLDQQSSFLPIIFNIAGIMMLSAGKFEKALEYVWMTAKHLGQKTSVMMLYSKFIEGYLCILQGRLDEAYAISHSSLVAIESSPSRYSGGGTTSPSFRPRSFTRRTNLPRQKNC